MTNLAKPLPLLLAVLMLAACGGGGGGGGGGAPTSVPVISQQQAYVKASNTGAGDEFGTSVALSADGSTLAVGAIGEASNAGGVGGDQANNTASFAGAVYVYTRSGATWTQQAYVKASNTGVVSQFEAVDLFGFSVAVSGDGSTLAVGARGEASAATGIGGDQADNSASKAGAVYVFQ
jgi:FG-GAP repeat protein